MSDSFFFSQGELGEFKRDGSLFGLENLEVLWSTRHPELSDWLGDEPPASVRLNASFKVV